MSKLPKLLIFSIVFLFLSCNDNPLVPNYSESYFPLKQGNKWYYLSYFNHNKMNYEYDLAYQVIGEKEIEGKIYSVLEKTYYDNNKQILKQDSIYCRFEGSTLSWLYKSQSGTYHKLIYVDFSVVEGNTYTCSLGMGGDDEYIFNVTVMIKTSELFTVYFDVPGGADEEKELTFKRNIGLQKFISQLGFELVKYELN